MTVTQVEVRIPDLGGADDVAVVEVLVSVGDAVAVDDSLIVLESEKASMDVPAPQAGLVAKMHLAVGDPAREGAVILALEVDEVVDEAAASTSQALDGQEREGTSEVVTPSVAGADSSASQPAQTKGEARQSTATATTIVAAPSQAVPSPAAPAEIRAVADEHHPLVVLGAGPGGYTAAFRAADLGLPVLLIEKYADLGGVCLNVGCIPSKALLHTAEVISAAAAMADHGVDFGEPKIDLGQLVQFKDRVVSRLTGGLATMAKQRGVEVRQGIARFASTHHFEIDGEGGVSTVSFDQLILAVGSRPFELPGYPYDDPRIWDSTDALKLDTVPERLLVVGGGIIGLEMATVYAALGSQITILELKPQLIPGCDLDLVRPLQRRLKKQGCRILLGTKASSIEASEDGLVATYEGKYQGDPETFDRVLVAVGRRANSDRIGIEAAEITVDGRGFVTVDRQQRTNQPHIFAIGDLVGEPQLAHKATHQAKVAAEVAAGHKSSFDARVIPSVAYTDPEIAWAGLTETAAKESGVVYQVAAFPWAASGRAIGVGRTEGTTKILFDPDTNKVLGAGLVGPHAGELIAEIALAIEMGAEAADLGLTIHPHPTFSETVAMAAEVFEGTVTDLYLGKKRR